MQDYFPNTVITLYISQSSQRGAMKGTSSHHLVIDPHVTITRN